MSGFIFFHGNDQKVSNLCRYSEYYSEIIFLGINETVLADIYEYGSLFSHLSEKRPDSGCICQTRIQ